ncbi:triose-phosphate isomerase [Leptotrichia sp. oral taxon 223]|uniref:triose-phosphate isomerase n=1 Tax=Leptotrichia sp. oral taxon 223 TaxID=712363 RepID=UPI0015BD2CFA|nr:triose-phosphate isomerase [Leptotrichia sp. oral taxon 223]NWO18593.1 triose-phosphate isomerase [Leptotrichia sp. oral taxon 223]
MRKVIVAGNWKMNKTAKEAAQFFNELKTLVADVKNAGIIIGAPFTALETATRETAGSNIKIAAENMNAKESGAYTGEVSPLMLKDLGVEYVILGHSERREYYHETDEIINEKVKSALAHDLKPILCIGEKLEQREAGTTNDVVKTQIVGGLKDVTAAEMANVVLAYEPVWAIGTGKTATPEQAQEVHAFIRGLLTDLYGKEVAENVTVQYGGSMNDGNAADLIAQTDIDGGLVGGASLIPEKFAVIIKAGDAAAK